MSFAIEKLLHQFAKTGVRLSLIFVIIFSCVMSGAGKSKQSQTATPTPEIVIARERARLMSDDEEARLDAVIRLGALGRRDAAQVAAAGLDDKSIRVRAAAVNAIGRLSQVDLTVNLLKAFADKNEFVRGQAAYAAGDTRGNQIIETRLMEILRTDDSAAVCGAAVVALGVLKSETSVPDLVELLDYKQQSKGLFRRSSKRRRIRENEFVRREAAVALGLIGDRRAVPVLIAQLNGERTPDDVRREAARALGLIGDVSARAALQGALTARDVYLAEIAFDALRRLERGS